MGFERVDPGSVAPEQLVIIFEVLCCLDLGFGLYIQHFPKKYKQTSFKPPILTTCKPGP